MYPPFDEAFQLNDEVSDPPDPNGDNRLPGQPMINIALYPDELYGFLDKDLQTPELDRMAKHLWLMATASGTNISPLHHQRIKGRGIILTEDPRLHLIWIDDKIFIKPIPPYLLSHVFWARFLLPKALNSGNSSPSSYSNAAAPEWEPRKAILAQAALGFLRSYFYLIRHSSDLDVALYHRLVPSGTTFEAFCYFASRFSSIPDTDVSPRYHYGELRLSRLNIWTKILLGQWEYEDVHRQYSQYFQRFFGPLLFVFGCFSVILSAMQVEMAVESIYSPSLNSLSTSQWPGFWALSRGFSVATLAFVALAALVLISLLFIKLGMEIVYAITHRTAPKALVEREKTLEKNRPEDGRP